jgi:hypothetical protein
MAEFPQDFVWEPKTDWGFWIAPYIEEVKRNAVSVVRQPKSGVRKVLADRALREVKTCKFCPNKLRHGNGTGVCTACHDKTRGKGPKPICSECKGEMNRTVKGGERMGTICYSCTRKAKSMRRQERLRKASEAYQRKLQITHCRECPTVLRRGNASGLCEKHRKAEWYRTKKASSKAA